MCIKLDMVLELFWLAPRMGMDCEMKVSESGWKFRELSICFPTHDVVRIVSKILMVLPCLNVP